MEFFLDTANLDEIRKWARWGLVQGVTTNPALLAREGREPLAQLASLAAAVEGPVSAQVTQQDPDAMVAQGLRLAEVAPNVVVKVPATEAGYQAARELAERGVACNVTLGFEIGQMVPFALLPVRFFSLIVGRVEDFGFSSLERVRAARTLLDRLGSPTRLLVASIRNPHHLRAAVEGGGDAVTVPPSTWSQLFAHPLTRQGEADFLSAWRALPHTLRIGYEQGDPAPIRAAAAGARR